mgnify:CR=1 FL=1
MKHEYKVGDMLKVKSSQLDEYVYCIITEFRNKETVSVFWITENSHIRNVPAYRSWTTHMLDFEFERLS